jgi:hypothetical protein
MRSLAVMCVLWAISWMFVLIGGAAFEAAAAVAIFSSR